MINSNGGSITGENRINFGNTPLDFDSAQVRNFNVVRGEKNDCNKQSLWGFFPSKHRKLYIYEIVLPLLP